MANDKGWRWGRELGSVDVAELEALQALVSSCRRMIYHPVGGRELGHLPGDARRGLEILARITEEAPAIRRRMCDAKGKVHGRVYRCRLTLNHHDDHRCGGITWRDTDGPRTWLWSCTIADDAGIANGAGQDQGEAYLEACRQYEMDVGHPPSRSATIRTVERPT